MRSAEVAVFALSVAGTTISAGREYRGASVRSTKNFSWMYLSTCDVSNNKSVAKLSAISSHMRMHESPISRCNRINLVEVIGCIFEMKSFKKFFRLMRNVWKECKTDPLTKIGLAPVSIKHSIWFIYWNLIPTRAYVSLLILAHYATSSCSSSREHIFAKRARDGEVNSSYSLIDIFLCSFARCCAVTNGADLILSHILSGFLLSEAPDWASIFRFAGSQELAFCGR